MKKRISKGTPEQFINLVENKIAELGGDVEACDTITASDETYVDHNGVMGEAGDTWTIQELRQYWDDEQMNDPVLSEYDSFDSWLDDTLSLMESVDSSTSISATTEDSTYYDRFIHTLMGDIESEVHGEVDGLTFDTLDSELKVTVVHGEDITEFSVPHEDLSFDFDTISDDVDYIVKTIKETLDSDIFSSASDVADAVAELNVSSAKKIDASVEGTDSQYIQELAQKAAHQASEDSGWSVTYSIVGGMISFVVSDGTHNIGKYIQLIGDIYPDWADLADDVQQLASKILSQVDADDDSAITEDEHNEIANTIWDILDHARNVLDSEYDLQDIAEYESREVSRKGNKYTCTLSLCHLTHHYTIDVCWTNDNGSLILDKSVEEYGQEIVDIYLEEYGYQEGKVNSATNTCGIACKPEILSSQSPSQCLLSKTWAGMINQLSELGYELDSAYREYSYDKYVIAYKDDKAYSIEVTRYSNGDYEVNTDNIVELADDIDDSYLIEDDENYYDDDITSNPNIFKEIASKSVPDFDGFMTDYTMYLNTDTGEYVFVFGDKEAYGPENSSFDWECETEERAWEWFNNYRGFDDDDTY